jgi:hypothetical protein
LSTTPEFDQEQLTAARAKAWRQDGNAIVTLEAARDWIAAQGLVLFAPRSAQLQTPAPSLVEATLGAANVAPTAAETDAARGFVARLAAEGLVVPLNLLGVPGELPDFVVSAQVFSYIFTLRGDKAWKVAPTTGVSPLGVSVYEALAASVKAGGGAMTAMQLANEVGREVSETAISRTLTELWSQLRVIPVLERAASDKSSATQWELTARRFTKAIKSGANAGQPTALSALVSLYLGQVFVATEEEVATFLSPLTARSRVRDVLHALMGARQLETLVVDGKTLLHIPGSLPQFPVAAVAEGEEPVVPFEKPKKVGTGRISSFKSEGKEASEFRGKPTRTFGKPAAGARKFAPRAGVKGPGAKFGARLDGKSDSERRPFKKAGDKPSYTKPWDENRPAKPRAAAPKDGFTKFRKPEPEDRAPLGPREQAGLPESKRTAPKASFERAAPRTFDRKPAFGAKPYAAKKAFGEKPAFGAKRPYVKRTEEDGERPSYKPRAYEGAGKTFAKKPYAAKSEDRAKPFAKKPYERKVFGDKLAFGAKKAFGDKPAFGAKRPYVKRTEEGGERPAYKPRAFGDAGAAAKPFAKKAYERKSLGDKPAFGAKPFAAKPGFAKRPYAKRAASSEPFEPGNVERTIAKRPHKPRAADADQRKFTNAPWVPPTDGGEGKKRGFKPRSGGARKPFGAGAKRPFTRKKPGASE